MPTIDVTGVNITMTAGTDGGIGGIGLPDAQGSIASHLGGFLEINVDVQRHRRRPEGVRHRRRRRADARHLPRRGHRRHADPHRPHRGRRVARRPATSRCARSTARSSTRRTTPRADVLGQTIDIDANGGSIGSVGNDLEIDSSRGSPFAVQRTRTAPTRRSAASSDPGLAAANDDVGLEATDEHLPHRDRRATCASCSRTPSTATSASRSASRPTTTRTSTSIEDGTARFAESNTRAPSGDDLDAPRSVPKGQIFAEAGKVTLQVGDDVAIHQNSRDRSPTTSIDIFGDYGDPDPGFGTNMILRGRIIADCVVANGPAERPPGRHVHAGDDEPGRRQAHPDLGQQRHRHVPARRPVRHRRRRDRRRRSTRSAATSSSARRRSSTAPQRAGLRADRVPSADVNLYARRRPEEPRRGHLRRLVPAVDERRDRPAAARPATAPATSLDARRPGRHRLLQRSTRPAATARARNYVINVLDTGAREQRRQTSSRSTASTTPTPTFNGYIAGTTTRKATDDIFLLRADEVHRRRDAVRRQRRACRPTCTSPTEKADRPAFVALLAGNNDPDGGLGLYRDRIAGQRAEQQGPADQLRHRAQRPPDRLRPAAATTRSSSTTRARS